ncbi:MAG TPA: TaqI-like C-terminal specificity domain-containing protein [Pyrinomonadaceae bacterium]|nr:TaqI-like C-terminal specificity domain-containing protein [Pyrinomonadaceae bacterium]
MPTDKGTQGGAAESLRIVEARLRAFRSGAPAEAAVGLLDALGYRGGKPAERGPETAEGLLAYAKRRDFRRREMARTEEWSSARLLFQLTDEDIREVSGSEKGEGRADARAEACAFVAVGLKGESYGCSVLADIAREINGLFPPSVVVLFGYGQSLTLAFAGGRGEAREGTLAQDVKVRLVKDIQVSRPQRAHAEILSGLSLQRLNAGHRLGGVAGLRAAWLRVLDTRELRRRFCVELSEWYSRALGEVVCPRRPGVPEELNRATNLMRLVTRTLFVWFLKERGLVPEELSRTGAFADVLEEETEGARGLAETLDRYKFTAEENTPGEEEWALDPEVLGSVFEHLLAGRNPRAGGSARKATGSFYTPREVVGYVADEALVAYLATRLGPESDAALQTRLRRLLNESGGPHGFEEAEVERLVRAIDGVKILDPACGSGAFLIGMLGKLAHALARLDSRNARWKRRQLERARAASRAAEKLEDESLREDARRDLRARLGEIEEVFREGAGVYARKLFLVENCLYGVDIQPAAVEIARLRVLLSLVAEQEVRPGAEGSRLPPLPNLETKLVAANALLGLEQTREAEPRDAALDESERALRLVRSLHFAARTPRAREKYRRRDERLRRRAGALLDAPGQFPHETAARLAAWNPYEQQTAADFFDARWMMGVEGGFDIVVGNPPYVRHEQLKELKPELRARYRCYAGAADLYVYFYEQGFNLLKAGGVLAYVSSNKFFRSGYGEPLREFLATRTRVLRLVDFGDAPLFGAAAYPCVVVASKARPDGREARALKWDAGARLGGFAARFESKSFNVRQTELPAAGWRLEGAAVLRLLDKLRASGRPLGEYVSGRLYRGVLTGLNEAFVVDRATRDRLVEEDSSSEELLKPFLRGRDVRRWLAEPQDLWVVFTRRGVDIRKYPAVERHLRRFRRRLTPGVVGGRKAGSYQWFEIQDRTGFWREFGRPKIIIPAIERDAEYAVDLRGHFGNDKTSICVTDSVNYLAGLLNSNVLCWFIRQTASTRRGGFYEFKPMYVSRLPVAEGTPKLRGAIEGRVGRILEARGRDASADVSGLEREINQLVYRLYGLTPDEAALVERDASAGSN